jgi:hypothetical protein
VQVDLSGANANENHSQLTQWPLSQLRLALMVTTRNRVARDYVETKQANKRKMRLVADEYGFLRATTQDYDLGGNRDPDGLLPTLFPGRK